MENRLMPSNAQVAGMIVPITREAPWGTPTKPQNNICGIKISGTRLVAISEVLTIAEMSKPSAIPTPAVTRTMKS